MNIRFNQDTSVDEMEFVRNTDKQLTKRQMKQVIRYINKNKILFNICWSDLVKIKYDRNEKMMNDFLNDIGKYHTVSISFPGKITEDFYNKYVELK